MEERKDGAAFTVPPFYPNAESRRLTAESQYIVVRGATENNLKNIDIDIPHRKMTALTGVSGSGKTSLALDTVYAEGQRRYIETLSTYARQFIGQMEKPKVSKIEGLSQRLLSRMPMLGKTRDPLSRRLRRYTMDSARLRQMG